jgi:hypothetical protein
MLSQVQIIRSLGEALAWFEKEVEWGASIAELRHLTGRIGELYAAMLTQGQMATAVNQPGYDVVARDGERISVKTITSSGRVMFNSRTLDFVDRIMIFRIEVDEDEGVSITTLLDVGRDDFDKHLRRLSTGEIDFPVRFTQRVARPLSDQIVIAEGCYADWTVKQYESGTIGLWHHDIPVPTVKPALRELAARLDVSILNSNDKPKNTRQHGIGVLSAITSLT